VRAFVAVFPPPETRSNAVAGALEAVQRFGGGSVDRVRWARPENVHLTLKFLGEIREEVLNDLYAVVAKTYAGHQPFDVTLTGLGAFPSTRRARILWVGVSEGSDQLRSLAVDLDDALAPLGFGREERPYTPHLTLGRIRGHAASFDLPSDVGDLGRFSVRCVELVESTLTPEGAVYRTVRTFAPR
jgi:2'-5' RNA ligase